MYIKDLTNFIPTNGFYSSHKWFISIIGSIESIVKTLYGSCELFDTTETDVSAYFKNQLNVMFMSKDFNYSKIYEALTAEYNPVWNVESKETLVYDRDNTGTQDSSGTNTGTQATSGSNTGTQSTSGTNTGTQATSGSDTGTQITADTTSNTTVESGTVYDSNNEFEKGQVVSTNSGNVQRTDNLAHSEQRTDNLAHSEQRTDNLAHTEQRTDNLAHSETREDDLHEHYSETKIRGGNIGVTKSSELVQDSADLRLNYNFNLIVARDIAEFISYAC